ncbi:hypothetical protein ACTJI8_17665, partial [Microbacterium sp. 22303]
GGLVFTRRNGLLFERRRQMIRTARNRSGKIRAIGTVRAYRGKVSGYLVPEFGDTPLRDIDVERIRVMIDRLDKIPAPLNPKSKFNGITRPVLIVLMMILRQAARDGVIPVAPNIVVSVDAGDHFVLHPIGRQPQAVRLGIHVTNGLERRSGPAPISDHAPPTRPGDNTPRSSRTGGSNHAEPGRPSPFRISPPGLRRK